MEGEAGEEIFLSLEEEVVSPPKAPKKASSKPKKTGRKPKTKVTQPPALEAELVDTTFVAQATGEFDVGWPLLGMDCPDCAGKAVRALNTLSQTDEIHVSATSGTVRFKVNFEHGHLAEVSSVLRSLGHAPDVEYKELCGVKASATATRNGVDRRKLGKVLRQQPGVLDVEFTEDDRVLMQLLPRASKELNEKRLKSLQDIIGSPVDFIAAKSNRLRPDQWRLVGGGIAVPLLLLVLLGEILGWSNTVIGIIAVPGLIVGGFQMFREAYASIVKYQLGFQVLTSLAVIGAAILGMWEEALIVAILVAFTAHLEGG